MRKLLFFALTAVLLPFVAKPSSAAVTLKQNWLAGQQLGYNTNIDGELNLQIPATANSIIAGMPLEISLRGTGKTTLITLKANDFGDGTVQAKIDPLTLEAETFGQKAVIKVNNGNGIMTLNGSPQPSSFIDWNLIANPPVALTFSPQLKVTDFASINQSVTTPSGDPAVPANIMAMIQNLILQSLPSVFPTKSLNVGDQWTSNVEFKTSPAPNAAVVKLGSFQFELKNPETMEGRSLQHITVHGDIDLPSAQSKNLVAAFVPSDSTDATDGSSKSSNSKMLSDMLANHLISFGQSVDGDLYFDAQAGHFFEADLNLNSEFQTLPDTSEPSQPDGFFKFEGTVRFKLAQVSTAATP